jgi:AraC family transcriptional regulator
MMHLSGFLGDTLSATKSADLYIALNSYGTDREFEEWHAHDNASISFLLSGGHTEELTGKTFNRKPGDIKFIAAGEEHRCNDYRNDTRKINIELPQALLKAMEMSEDDVARVIATHPRAKFALLKFYRELLNDPDNYAASWQLLLLELVCPAGPGHQRQYKSPPAWIIQLKELLHERCHEQLELAEIARLLGIHPVTISRYFPVYFDVTLSSYLRDIRVAKALSLIKGSHQSLTEIGLACGFSDQPHFTHSFKKVTGYLPKHYRRL